MSQSVVTVRAFFNLRFFIENWSCRVLILLLYIFIGDNSNCVASGRFKYSINVGYLWASWTSEPSEPSDVTGDITVEI